MRTQTADSGPQEMILSVDGQSMTGTWKESRFTQAAIVKLSSIAIAPSITTSEQRNGMWFVR